MAESHVGLLIKSATLLEEGNSNPVQNILRSYYLMRCRELTKGNGLPKKIFSSDVRCSRCFLEWKNGTEIKIDKFNSRKNIKSEKSYQQNRNKLHKSDHGQTIKKIDIKCDFCNNVTTTKSLKPIYRNKIKNIESIKKSLVNRVKPETDIVSKKNVQKTGKEISKNTISNNKNNEQNLNDNVYSKTKDVFSLSNKNNLLQNVTKEQKIIKNNKRKKDKFAGLCQQAVLASAKLKEEKDKKNKLNLFLKPSL